MRVWGVEIPSTRPAELLAATIECRRGRSEGADRKCRWHAQWLGRCVSREGPGLGGPLVLVNDAAEQVASTDDQNFVSFGAPDGRIGFLDELCPHRQSSLLLARSEGEALRCIYTEWKIDVSGHVVEAPTQVIRHDQLCAGVAVAHFPVHEEAGIAWVWLGAGQLPPFPDLPFNDEYGLQMVTTISLVPANWLQGLEGGMDSVHAPILHRSVIEATLQQKDDPDTEGVRATIAAPPIRN
jgi:nitrite reductase/ring-hydroxylating ferredoxin subunit